MRPTCRVATRSELIMLHLAERDGYFTAKHRTQCGDIDWSWRPSYDVRSGTYPIAIRRGFLVSSIQFQTTIGDDGVIHLPSGISVPPGEAAVPIVPKAAPSAG